MHDYSELAPIPDKSEINTLCTYLSEKEMLNLFGKPGALTTDCSEPTNPKILSNLVQLDITPHIHVRAFKPFAIALKKGFDDLKVGNFDLYNQVKSAGALCCRAIRGSTKNYSKHSYGCSIDLYCGSDVTALGDPHTQLGIKIVYSYLKKYDIFWGAGFKRPDSMHYEASKEMLYKYFDIT